MLMFHQLGEDGLTYNTNLGEFQQSTLFRDPPTVAGADLAAAITSVNTSLKKHIRSSRSNTGRQRHTSRSDEFSNYNQ